MDTDKRPAAESALGGFLRARRAQLRPEDAGLSTSGRRRVPGLRREEVALLAGVSVDYYMRLEQGRERHPSRQVLDAVAKALRLDDAAVGYLYQVAVPSARRMRRSHRVERVSRPMQQLIESWSDTPAFILGHSLDILARNQLAEALHTGFNYSDNLVRMTFLDSFARDFYREWDRAAVSCVAALRQAAGGDPDDRRLIELVGELSVKSGEFRDLWARHDVQGKTREAKLFRHPAVGDLELHYEAFTIHSAADQQLVVYQAEAGSPSVDALALLGSLSAVPAPQTPP
ncbi:helix-turn-helix transcriptional regulator [Streptomyces sp. AM8-1-1]|uniref:helix-turn-helix domain-containing protein n=1 Tax=Streptomyces sp. AM8-1-1 TaxID=3075825 RepID=UPI0028C45669|nr:helix-turn-helix transcriptional regulator [Streptomyces sp. AM8-1-1]WNO70339.1 helix-turn-helix transcriptional regulator [Streptomyces sp. AM8-1-1]